MLRKFNRKDALILLSLLVFAALVRIYVACVTCVIQRDGVTYVTLARMIAAGNLFQALSYSLSHPLYPTLIAQLGKLAGNYIIAGVAISIILGTLTLIPFYLLGKELVGKTPALVAAALLAAYPYHARFSATVLADPTYIFFVFLALWLAYGQIAGQTVYRGLLAGLAVGLAYLTKPEGLALLPLVVGVTMLSSEPLPERGRRLLRSAVAVIAGFIVVASPYLLFLHQLTGGWLLTQKIALSEFVRVPASQAGLLANLYEWLRTFTETLHPLLLAVLLVGLVYRRQVCRRRQALYGVGFLILFGLLTAWRLSSSGYLSKRQMLPIAMVCLWWSGTGVVELAGWAGRLGHTRAGRKLPAVITAVLMVLVSIKTLQPQGRDKLPLKLTGEWIARNWQASRSPRAFHWAQSRPLFYANAYTLDSHLAGKGLRTYQAVLKVLQARDADLFVARASRLTSAIPDWPRNEALSGMSLVHSQLVKHKGEKDYVLVFVLDGSGNLLSD